MRASTSAWLSGESLGMSAACGMPASLFDVERRPPRSAATTGACSFDRASLVARAAAGATVATAEARAARRANSRRGMPAGLAGLGLEVSSIRSSLISLSVRGAGCTLSAGKEEATESRGEGQQRGKRGERKEARGKKQRATPPAIYMDLNTKELHEEDSYVKSVTSDKKGSEASCDGREGGT